MYRGTTHRSLSGTFGEPTKGPGVMGQAPDVTVVVAAYNGMPYIVQMLESLLRQTIGLDRMQVLVIDDGSTDGTPDFLRKAAEDHPCIEVITQANSGGPAQPRNLALQHVRGRYIFFLDEDDYLSDDALEAMVRAADDNGTDVVLGRFRGLGGRNTPRAMFLRTVPRTDVFSSPAYWLLNPLKLFRAEMVRSLGLRFALDMPWGEDQPFVAGAYFGGDGISILSDKDYLFWVYRRDRSNITTRSVSLSDRMPVVDRMFDLVAANVPPGPARDRLMRRHFRVELVDSALEGYRTEGDGERRAAAFARLREIVDAYYTEGIECELPPKDRVLLRLISEGRADELAAYLDLCAAAAPPAVLLEDGHVYLEIPWFRDEARRLPDALFDIAGKLRVECRLEPLVTSARGVRLDAACQFGSLTGRVTDVDLVVRSRQGQEEMLVPLAHEIVVEEKRPFLRVGDDIPGERLLADLPAGLYDLYVRVAAGETWRERRLSECAPPPDEPRVVHRRWGRRWTKHGVLATAGTGSLVLRVVDGEAVTRVRKWRRRIAGARRRLSTAWRSAWRRASVR